MENGTFSYNDPCVHLTFPECFVKHESVKLEKQMIVHGQMSKCYSVEPVLRCLSGCAPVRTTPVTVGFHCVPIGESTKQTYTFTLNIICGLEKQ